MALGTPTRKVTYSPNFGPSQLDCSGTILAASKSNEIHVKRYFLSVVAAFGSAHEMRNLIIFLFCLIYKSVKRADLVFPRNSLKQNSEDYLPVIFENMQMLGLWSLM